MDDTVPRRKKSKWEYGAVFAVPLNDGSFGIAQAIDHWMPHWVYVALFRIRCDSLPDKPMELSQDDAISLVAVSADELDFGEWPLIGNADLVFSRSDFPNEQFRSTGYVGAKSYDAGLAAEFLSAFHCITPWDDWHDPNYLDAFLRDIDLKPKRLVYKASLDAPQETES